MRSTFHRLLTLYALPFLVALAIYRSSAWTFNWPDWVARVVFLVACVTAHRTVMPHVTYRMDWGAAAGVTVRLVTIAVIVAGAFGLGFAIAPVVLSWALGTAPAKISAPQNMDIGRWVVAVACSVWAHRYATHLNLPVRYDPTVRGRSLLPYEEAYARQKAKLSPTKPGLYRWGGLLLEESAATKHFMVVGQTGSGKTLTLQLLMRSVVMQMRQRRNTRMLVYDAKQDVVANLEQMGVPAGDIRILNPFDERCVAWDICADITDQASAQQIASILIPPDNDVNRFFSDAVRDILTGVLTTFMLSKTPWTLRDVVLAMYSEQATLYAILTRSPGGHRFAAYFDDRRTYANIRSTINTKMAPYSIVAAAWEGRPRMSLQDWLDHPCVLVLGNHESCRAALDSINRVIFKRLTELILSGPEVPDDAPDPTRLWVFLDEVREAGYLDGLSRLLNKGRGKGACVVLGFQDMDGMISVYGAEVAKELTGECSCKAVLRIANPSTADWASSLFGYAEALHWSETFQQSGGGSRSVGVYPTTIVLPSQIMDIAPTKPANGLFGYYFVEDVGVYPHWASWADLVKNLPHLEPDGRPREALENFRQRTGDYQSLQEWTSEEASSRGQDTTAPAPSRPGTEVPGPAPGKPDSEDQRREMRVPSS